MRPTNLKTTTYAILIVAIATIFSCKKKDHQDQPTTPTTGTLTGTVQTWDDKMNQINDKGSITVSIQSGGDSSSTLTDTTGKFVFNNLPFGTYNLTFSKAGYGTMKMFGVQHAYNASQTPTVVSNINFGKIAATGVSSLGVRDTVIYGMPGIRFSYGFTPKPATTDTVFARFFLGTDSTVSSTNYTAVDSLRTIQFQVFVPVGFTDSTLKTMGFTSGQTVYFRMYGDSYVSNSYVDSATGKRVFPNVNPTTPKAVWRTIQ